MRVIYRKILHARYLYIKRNVEKVWGAHYTLGARYLSKNTVYAFSGIAIRMNVYYAAGDGSSNSLDKAVFFHIQSYLKRPVQSQLH